MKLVFTLLLAFIIGLPANLVAALGITNILQFSPSDAALTIASSSAALPILIDSGDAEALHIAVSTFAEDILRVTGVKPEIHKDVLPDGTTLAIVAATVGSEVIKRLRKRTSSLIASAQKLLSKDKGGLEGKWESYNVEVATDVLDLKEALVVEGSDTRGTIYALYTLSELMGVSPWYWWADVPVKTHSIIAFPRNSKLAHGEPTVKYRGFFLNDEQPVLWNWAREHFKMGTEPPFQTGMYEKIYELLLRLRGNYLWPAMWASMFAVDGQNVSEGLPKTPTPGPNQVLAHRMGVVMGTSHHEPMSRNQKEFDEFGSGEWRYDTNANFLKEFWRYGVERAKDCETVFTVGMRGNGDLPLDGANVKLLEQITADQQNILKEIIKDRPLKDIPQMWAMYKEVMGYFANGLQVPEEVTSLLADDNWGNLQAVLPEGRVSEGGGGVYYHADYVGDPRDYKWTNTVPLAKMWEQMHVAKTFNTKKIWILNVGDLKNLEIPLEYFLDIGYDSDRWPRESLLEYLGARATRDFGIEDSTAVAKLMAKYSVLASRRKAELIDSNTYSLINYNEAENVIAEWTELEKEAKAIHDSLPKAYQTPFYELVYSPVQLNANLNRLYISAARSNLYATQSRTAANIFANDALAKFDRDWELTQEYHQLEGGKWNYMLCQTHIAYQYWQAPMRNSMPPISFVSKHDMSYPTRYLGPVAIRFTVENSLGAWPGDNKHNCEKGYQCPDPVLLPMDYFGKPRWIDVGSGGPVDVEFTAKADKSWLNLSSTSGTIKGDGSTDIRVEVTIDWAAFEKDPSDAANIDFESSDTATMTVTVPIHRATQPPADFHGAVQGDGYIAIEAAHYQSATQGDVAWLEIPYYGRTLSGMAIYPLGRYDFALGSGPAIQYDFWVHHLQENTVDVTLHIGPTLNYFLGKKLALGLQIDDGKAQRIEPIPDAPLGDLPHDWEEVVANEIRQVTATLPIRGLGKHSLIIHGVTAGIVLERLLIDFGGIKKRGYSYLGPPESVIV